MLSDHVLRVRGGLGEQEVTDKPPNKNAHCTMLKLAGGVPAAGALIISLIFCIVLWVTKTRTVSQLSGSEMVFSLCILLPCTWYFVLLRVPGLVKV